MEFTTNNLDYPVARLMIGGPADKKDRIFFSSAQTIRGVTRKGKEFFRFATDGAEVRVCARTHTYDRARKGGGGWGARNLKLHTIQPRTVSPTPYTPNRVNTVGSKAWFEASPTAQTGTVAHSPTQSRTLEPTATRHVGFGV